MTPEEIKVEFFKRRKKLSRTGLAKQIGVSRQAVAAAIDRKMTSRKVMVAISEAIGRDPHYVFPELIKNECNNR